MTELPEKFEKYDMLEYLANSFPYNKEDYAVEAKALLDLMGTYYTSMGYPVILREMVRQLIDENYKPRIQAFFRGGTKYANKELEKFGKQFNDAFIETIGQYWEENEA